MGDMYSRLGDLLNEALEKGEIPEKNINEAKENETSVRKNDEITENESVKAENSEKKEDNEENIRKVLNIFTQKSHISRVEVIKMHKYTEFLHITPEIQQALSTLHIVYPKNWREIKRQYHKLLKEYHPDTKNTIQSSESVDNFSQTDLDGIQRAYEYLKQVYNK